MDEPLPRWFASYAGTGRGAVTREGFAEPYGGDLLGVDTEPKLAILGLNPGGYLPEFQSRQGLFADELRRVGSYSTWVRGAPYASDLWTDRHGKNRYGNTRLTFVSRWVGLSETTSGDLFTFELYPWHSTGVTGSMRPPPDIMDRFVWQPLSEFAMPFVFAFGREWDMAAKALDLPCVRQLGRGGEDYGSLVASRSVRVYELPSGQRLVVEWHSGSAGPPSANETELLRAALTT